MLCYQTRLPTTPQDNSLVVSVTLVCMSVWTYMDEHVHASPCMFVKEVSLTDCVSVCIQMQHHVRLGRKFLVYVGHDLHTCKSVCTVTCNELNFPYDRSRSPDRWKYCHILYVNTFQRSGDRQRLYGNTFQRSGDRRRWWAILRFGNLVIPRWWAITWKPDFKEQSLTDKIV